MTALKTALNTLLFDLDGTLLPLELDVFMKGYFRALLPRISHLLEPETATKEIWAATAAMIRNEDPNLTNEQVFKAAFFGRAAVTEEDIWPLFDEFYRRDFAELRSLSEPSAISREICRNALEKGYRVVVATNPIFPETAIRWRLEWAGVGDLPFDLVTTMENSHFCKPSPKYYVEIMDKLGVSPFECIMFGNDVQEDGVAGKIGMQTYLVTDCLIDRGVGHLEFDHRGTLADARAFVEALPMLSETEGSH
ncbi:HAD family hydrolase [Alicyclobacillus sp. ALC3]|uniref:HAD family hydrolase n=1 Tax=Alicyclobacillus sp. ALC3 TaxID=2796143 RepID=UPI0023782D94|nr:HAD family hydrolase [Alicyclobacillus sp. ALC3]